MRTLPGPMEAGLAEHIPFPVYLVEVLLTPPLYWGTAEISSWNGNSWQPNAVVVESISETGAHLRLRNDNNSGSALVLNNTLRDVEFRIYLYYSGDAVEVFRGYGSDAAVAAMDVNISLIGHRAINALIPRKRLAGPTFTHLPKLGEVIEWGPDSYKVTF